MHTDVSNPQYSNTKQSLSVSKARWSREEKRGQRIEQKSSNERQQTKRTDSPGRRAWKTSLPKRTKVKIPRRQQQLNPIERALECASKALHTQAVSIHLPDHQDASSSLSSLQVITSSSFPTNQQHLHHSLSSTPTIYVKPLLVLDLNGILCYRIRKGRDVDWAHLPFRSSVGHVAMTSIVPRTNLYGFLSCLEAHFTLAIWTSAKERTAKDLIEMLFPAPLVEKLLFVWSQSRCEAIKPSQ
jgi:hypothetical protein